LCVSTDMFVKVTVPPVTMLALVPAIVILAARGASARKVGIPFAPFLAGGAVVALFLGDAILDWWLG